jgi:hypothetical protein
VQWFCKEHGPCYVVFISRGYKKTPGPITVARAKRYSADQRTWVPLAPGLGLRTKYTTGFWFEDLEQVQSGTMALGSFVKQDGQTLDGFTNISSAYPVERVRPLQEGDYSILAVGRLAKPFAVYLRQQ